MQGSLQNEHQASRHFKTVSISLQVEYKNVNTQSLLHSFNKV